MTEAYSTTNPFAPMKKASFDTAEEVENDRPEYVEPEVEASDDNAEETSVPDGTAKEVMDWVDDDKDRALQALHAEEAKEDGGRTGLKRDLNKLIEN